MHRLDAFLQDETRVPLITKMNDLGGTQFSISFRHMNEFFFTWEQCEHTTLPKLLLPFLQLQTTAQHINNLN